MPKTDRPGRRSLAWALAGVVVFVGVLVTLPVPEVAEGPAPGMHEENFAIVDVTLFDGEAFRHGWDVWVEDGRIRHAGQRLDLPEELPRLDGRGYTLTPGLIDGHVHSFPSTLNDALRFGVTTVLDQSTDPAFAAAKRPAREEVGRSTEADLFSAGMTATAPDGHGTQYGVPVETLTGPDEAAGWVGARKAEGSDWIKIIYEDGSAFDMEIASLDGEIVAAVIEAAHAEGLAAVVQQPGRTTALAQLRRALSNLGGALCLFPPFFPPVLALVFPESHQFLRLSARGEDQLDLLPECRCRLRGFPNLLNRDTGVGAPVVPRAAPLQESARDLQTSLGLLDGAAQTPFAEALRCSPAEDGRPDYPRTIEMVSPSFPIILAQLPTQSLQGKLFLKIGPFRQPSAHL